MLPSARIKKISGLNFSIQQVARELPSLAMGPQMFFLAISNNLPILQDELRKARAEFNALAAEGKQGVPVWKQVVSSLFSWQTALVAGITLLVMYAPKLVEWAKSLSKASDAMLSATERQKAMKKEMEETHKETGKLMITLRKLQEEWNSFGNDLNAKKKFIAENKKEFDNLGVSVTGVSDAENLLVRNTDVFIDALKRKARAAAAYNLSMAENEKLLNKQMEIEELAAKMPEKAPRDHLRYYTLPTGAVASDYSNEYIEWLNNTENLEKLKKEETAIQGNIDAYFRLGYAAEETAKKELAAAGIREKAKENGPDRTKKLQAELQRQADAAQKLMRLQEQLDNDMARLEQQAQDRRIDLMEEGFEKRMAQNDANYKKEIQAIREQEQAMLKTLQESERAQWEAGGRKGTFTPSTVALPEDMQKAIDEQMSLAKEAFRKGSENIVREQAEAWREEELRFASHLDRELADINKYYKERIAKAKGDTALVAKLEENRDREMRDAIRKYYADIRIEAVDHEEQMALIELEGQKDSFALTSLYELKKLKIVQQANKKRLSELQHLHDNATGTDQAGYAKEINQLTEDMARNSVDMERGIKGVVSEALSGIRDVASSLKGMNSELDEALQLASHSVGIVSQLASGNYIGAIVSVIGLLIEAFSNEEAERRQAEQTQQRTAGYWESVNLLIEKRIDLIKELNDVSLQSIKLTEEQLKEQRALLSDGIQAYAASFANLWDMDLKVLGQSASRAYVAGKNMIQDFSKAMRTADEEAARLLDRATSYVAKLTDGRDGFNIGGFLMGLSDEDIIKLREIPAIWALIPEGIQESIIKLSEFYEKTDELGEAVREIFTATTSDSIVDSIVDGFREGKRSAQDFADSFEDMMKEAVLQSVKINALKKPVEDWCASFAEASKDGLTKEEIEYLRKMYEDIIAASDKAMADFELATGLSFAAEQAANDMRSAARKGIESVSQDSVDKLTGMFSTSLFYQDKIYRQGETALDMAMDGIAIMAEIRDNTAHCKRLENIERHIYRLSTIVDHGISVKR